MGSISALIQKAEGGDAEAQVQLGKCYAEGTNGATQDSAEAFKWFRMAAEQGNAAGQICLGGCYENGNGVPEDLDEAVKWYRKSAEQGYSDGQNCLGGCYEEGVGVTRDLNEAVKWYRLAAEQGHAYAQYFLGVCYHEGKGVTKDRNEAFKWHRLSAEQGNEYALNRIKLSACGGNKEAFDFISQLAQRGDEKMQIFVAECYENGRCVDRNLSEAAKWYRMAAEQGDADSQCKLGKWYQSGWGLTQDTKQAIKWYSKAAKQGNRDAYLHIESFSRSGKEAFDFISQLVHEGNKEMQIFVAKCYENGWGVDRNLTEAVKWYRLAAAEPGNADAQYQLGLRYESGNGVTKNLDAAAKWYGMAAEQGNGNALKSVVKLATTGTKGALEALLALAQQNNIEAQNMMGWCYEKGKGVNRDINEAIKWYRKAAEQGDQKASASLQYCIEYLSKDSFSYISKSTAADLSLNETSPFLPIESFESSVTNATGLLLSPDDKLIVIFRDDEPAMTVMFESFTWKEKWRQQNSNIKPKAFSPDSNFLLVCQKDGPTAAILDANTGTLVRELSGHTQKVNAAAWSSSNLIATGSDDTTICIFRADGTLVRVLTGHKAAVSSLAFASDGNLLLSHSLHFMGTYLWDVAAGTFRSPVLFYQMESAKMSPDGLLIAVVRRGTMEFFQANDKEYVNLHRAFNRTLPITWSRDSKHLLAKDAQTLYSFFFTKEGPLCTSFHHSKDISAMAILSDGDRAVTIDNKGRVEYHLCLLENALPLEPFKISAIQMPLSGIPLFIPKPSHSLQEALDRTRVLIDRTLLPTSFQTLQRVLQRINDSSLSGISTRVRTEKAIEDMFAHISPCIGSESHPESAPESLKQSTAAIESAIQDLLADDSLPTSLSLLSSSESNALLADGSIAHAVPAGLSKTELDIILRFSHNANNKLRALEKVLSVRAALFGEAIVEFDNFASELRVKSETNSEDFTGLVAQMKQVIAAISASDVHDVNAMDTSTSNKEINESAATKTTHDNQSIKKSNEDDSENDLESMILLHEIRIPDGMVNDVKVSPDGNILAIALHKGLVVFDTRSKIELWKTSNSTQHIAFSPTSTQLAAVMETEEDVVIFEAETGARVFSFPTGRGKAFTVAWSNNNVIASSHAATPCILVRHMNGEAYGHYDDENGASDLSFSPDSTRLAVAKNREGLLIIQLFNQEDNGYFRSEPRVPYIEEGISRTAFSPDGNKLALTSSRGWICISDSKTLKTTNEFQFDAEVDISWSRNSRFLAVICSYENWFKILASDGNQLNKSVFQQKILGRRVAFSLDGSEIITVNESRGVVQFWMSPLFMTLMTQPMPSADNDQIPFGQLQTLPPIDAQPVEHLFDRITTLIDRMDHPQSFQHLVDLLHQVRNATSVSLKISESDADFLVIDSSSSSSSSSFSSEQTRIRKSTFESMLDFVNVNGKKLLELESKLLCQADMFSKALIAYDHFVGELRTASEQHIDKLKGFFAYLSKPAISADRIYHIRSTIASARQLLHESSNQLSSNMVIVPASNPTVGQPHRPEEVSSPDNGITKRPRIEPDQA